MTNRTKKREDTRRWRSERCSPAWGPDAGRTWYRISVQDWPGDAFNECAGLVYRDETIVGGTTYWTAERSFFPSNRPAAVETEHATKREAIEALLEWAGLEWEQRVDLARAAS